MINCLLLKNGVTNCLLLKIRANCAINPKNAWLLCWSLVFAVSGYVCCEHEAKASFPLIAKANSQRVLSNILIG